MAARHPEKDPNRIPRQGTALRRAYDYLLCGESVDLTRLIGRNLSKAYAKQLRDFYDMEIASESYCGYRLLGRWIGNDFVPVERLSENCSTEPS